MEPSVILVIVLLLLLSALFSLIEVAFLSISPIQVDAFIKQKRFGAKSVKQLKTNTRSVIITLLFCNTLVNFSAVSIASVILLEFFPRNGILLATVLMTILILIFGQIIPKVLGEQYAENVLLYLSRPTLALIFVLKPLTYFFEQISKRLPFSESKETSPEEFISMIRSSRKGGVISKKSETLISNLIAFQNLSAEDIVTPQPQVKLFSSKSTIQDAIKIAKRFPHTHFPVFENKETDIIGVVSSTQLLQHSSSLKKRISGLVQKTLTIPDSKNAEELLLDLEDEGFDVAVVVDEYGTFVGIITIEDILKHFLGKIPIAEIQSKRRTLFSGSTSLESIAERFSVKMFDTKKKTISGLIEEHLQQIPKKGEVLSVNGLTFTVIESTRSKIVTVKIEGNN